MSDDETRHATMIRVAGFAVREAKVCVLNGNTDAALSRIEECKLALADYDLALEVERSQRAAHQA